jgi:cell wall assembly regulator SMI1
MTDVAASWHRIEAWLRVRAPEVLDELEGPATEAAMQRVTAAVGDLPHDYRALMTIHGGVEAPHGGPGVFEGFDLHSLDAALRAREVMLDVRQENASHGDIDEDMRPDPGVRKAWWHDRWLPIAVHAGDSRTILFMDLDPAPGGKRGQLVRHVVELDSLRVVADSVAQWLDRIARMLESGNVSVSRDGDLISLDWPRR